MHMFANLTGDTANATATVAGAALESLQNAGSFLFQTASSYASNIVQQAPNIGLTEYIPTTSYNGFNQMDASHREIYYISFNQDSTSLGVGHEGGYHIYNMGSIENTNGSGLQVVHKSSSPEKTCIVERLFQSSLITFVSLNQSRKLQVYHYKLGNDICSHSYTTAVKAVRMNRKRVIVCLEESIHVHNIRDMRLLHMIRDTPTNKDGLIDLCSNDANCYLAYPGSATHGHVNVFDADQLAATCIIPAHEAPLSALRFNSEGNKLATASTKGTVIRVFAIPSGDRLYEFTRGVKRCVQIHMLAFSHDSKYLCSSSNTETIHVFSLAKAEQLKQQASQTKADENDQSLSSWVSYFSQQASNYLPTQMNELMLREKSYATARLPVVGSKTCCAIPRIGNRDYLAVASTDGYLFCYTIPPEAGECTLARQYRIGPLADEEAGEMSEVPRPPTTTKPIYPNVDAQAVDVAPVGSIGSYGTSPLNRSPPLIPSSAQVSQSPLSSSPVVKARQKTVSQSSTGVPGVLSGSPANTPTKAFASATIPAPKSKIRKNSSSSGSSIESADGSIGSGSSHEKKQGKAGPGDVNNIDEFPPLGDFE